MSATESDEARAQRVWDHKSKSARFADLAAEIGAEHAAGRWELGNGQRIAVDYGLSPCGWARGIQG